LLEPKRKKKRVSKFQSDLDMGSRSEKLLKGPIIERGTHHHGMGGKYL